MTQAQQRGHVTQDGKDGKTYEQFLKQEHQDQDDYPCRPIAYTDPAWDAEPLCADSRITNHDRSTKDAGISTELIPDLESAPRFRPARAGQPG